MHGESLSQRFRHCVCPRFPHRTNTHEHTVVPRLERTHHGHRCQRYRHRRSRVPLHGLQDGRLLQVGGKSTEGVCLELQKVRQCIHRHQSRIAQHRRRNRFQKQGHRPQPPAVLQDERKDYPQDNQSHGEENVSRCGNCRLQNGHQRPHLVLGQQF